MLKGPDNHLFLLTLQQVLGECTTWDEVQVLVKLTGRMYQNGMFNDKVGALVKAEVLSALEKI